MLEGNLDISFWSYICILSVKEHGIGNPHWADMFSNILAFLMLILVTLALILSWCKASQHFKNKKRKE